MTIIIITIIPSRAEPARDGRAKQIKKLLKYK